MTQFDISIKNGFIVDGTGNPWFRSDVHLKRGKIQKIGRLLEYQTKKVIDAEGLIVAPGFIDIHSHADFTLLSNPLAESKVRQGVTTDVIGNCGVSAAPVKHGKLYTAPLPNFVDIVCDWSTMGEYFGKLERQGISVNVASFVGHGTVRVAVMGYDPAEPNGEQLEEMKKLIAQAMVDGALGMSSGLTYPPGCFAKTSELIELCKVVRRYGGVYATHTRGLGENMLEATKEAIEIGESAGVPVQISHLMPGVLVFGTAKDNLALIEEARSRGLDVTTDEQVYTRGETELRALLPDWAKYGGDEEMIRRLKDPEKRQRIKEETLVKGALAGGSPKRDLIKMGRWDKIWLAQCRKNIDLCGKSFKEIAELRGVDPFNVLFDILIEEGGEGSITAEDKSLVDIIDVLKHPTSMVESDGFALATYEVFTKAKVHPRSYGNFPRLLGEFVREKKVLPLEDAIRKVTSFPAFKLGLHGRGLIREDMWADLVIFDRNRVKDVATYDDPHRYSEGIEYVLVNGQVTIEKGEHLKIKAGKALRHAHK